MSTHVLMNTVFANFSNKSNSCCKSQVPSFSSRVPLHAVSLISQGDRAYRVNLSSLDFAYALSHSIIMNVMVSHTSEPSANRWIAVHHQIISMTCSLQMKSNKALTACDLKTSSLLSVSASSTSWSHPA